MQGSKRTPLAKSRTGIEGLDEVTHGGLPTGRATLLSGSAGAGKTVLAMEFLIHGALDYNGPGVFGDRRRVMLRILKSRGMAHSREMVEFMMSSEGIHLGNSHPKECKNSGNRQVERVETPSSEVAHGEDPR